MFLVDRRDRRARRGDHRRSREGLGLGLPGNAEGASWAPSESPRPRANRERLGGRRRLERRHCGAGLELQGDRSLSGLSRLDRKLLEVLVTRNRPLGLRSLADLIGETQKTVVETYE